MSEEMAVNDNASKEETEVAKDEAVVEGDMDAADPALDSPPEVPLEKCEEESKTDAELKEENDDDNVEGVKPEINEEIDDIPMNEAPVQETTMGDEPTHSCLPEDDKRGFKRRASTSLSDIDESEEFRGFDEVEESSWADYNKTVERLEAEVTEAVKSITPLRSVRASSITVVRASKRARQDTDGSRPSSALSSRSDGDCAVSTDASMSPLGAIGGRGRRSTVEMSSPMLRVPLERGWKRELVFRAALDSHSRRNADIYYYTPAGKKLRSTREVAEQLSGTGLTLENFSFCKEPLGIDDPEKEIIRDAKVMRRVESPVPAAPPQVEGKRTPKPKPPKGASPEPPATKSPTAKLKVKSVGSRLSSAVTPTAVTPKQTRKPQPQAAQPAATATGVSAATAVTPAPATTATTPTTPAATPAAVDNNNTAWKKPRPAPPALTSRQQPAPPAPQPVPPRQLVQPCSMTCGRGVPSLACAACLCLYHPACVGMTHVTRDAFYCKNCRKASPPLETSSLAHKPGAAPVASAAAPTPPSAAQPPPGSNAPPRRLPVPLPVPAKVARGDKRVLLRMKVAGGGPDGSRLWAVTKGPASTSSAPASPALPTASTTQPPPPKPVPAAPTPVHNPPVATARPSLPQSLAVLNGRRFIVVPRALVQASHI